jgi:hypothetical protein
MRHRLHRRRRRELDWSYRLSKAMRRLNIFKWMYGYRLCLSSKSAAFTFPYPPLPHLLSLFFCISSSLFKSLISLDRAAVAAVLKSSAEAS